MRGDLPAQLRFLPQGDRALVVQFGERIAPEVFAEVQSLKLSLQGALPSGIIELVPTYRSLMIVYDPDRVSYDQLKEEVIALWPQETIALDQGRIVVIPTCYGGAFGPDLDELSELVGLSPQEVVAEHGARDYLIYMLGFTPGFPYLGGLSERIACPRLSSPRTLVPAGSVGIAEQQTGIYPLDTPGGWRLIGRSPLRIFDPAAEQPFLLQAGDWLRFVSIDPDDYARIEAEIAAGSWQPQFVERREV